jgi:hypothetical protein
VRTVPEDDWKKLRALKDDALNLACERIFEQIEKVAGQRKGKEHQAYVELWRMIEKEDREISAMFDDLKRSDAIYKLAAWRRNGVISEDTLTEFSDETRREIELLNEGFG